MDLSWHNTDHVWLLLCLTYFYMSYCPLLKFRFPDFSLLSFDILTWNFIYEFVLTYYSQVKFDFGRVWPTFYTSYCPLLKFRFLDFSLPSFDILTWNFMYEFVSTWYRSSLNFVVFDLLLIELLPFAKFIFSDFSLPLFVTMTFGIWICLHMIQIKFFDFYCIWPNCTPDIFFCFNLVFCTFLSRLARYGHQIWGMNCIDINFI